MTDTLHSWKVIVPQGWYVFYRDFQFRYGLTLLGYFWSIVRPIASSLPLIFVGQQFNLGSDLGPLPYPIYALTGIILWNVFWDAFTMPMFLMHRTRTVLRRVPLHPDALLWGTLVSVAINLVVNLFILAIAAVVFKTGFAWTSPIAMMLIFFLAFAGLAVGLPVASITAVYHDMRYGVGFLGQLFLWSAPIVHTIPPTGTLHWINKMNPLTYLINAPRDLFFTGAIAQQSAFIESATLTLVLFFVGRWFYRSTIRMSYDYVV